jgi:hypothetical protein
MINITIMGQVVGKASSQLLQACVSSDNDFPVASHFLSPDFEQVSTDVNSPRDSASLDVFPGTLSFSAKFNALRYRGTRA